MGLESCWSIRIPRRWSVRKEGNEEVSACSTIPGLAWLGLTPSWREHRTHKQVPVHRSGSYQTIFVVLTVLLFSRPSHPPFWVVRCAFGPVTFGHPRTATANELQGQVSAVSTGVATSWPTAWRDDGRGGTHRTAKQLAPLVGGQLAKGLTGAVSCKQAGRFDGGTWLAAWSQSLGSQTGGS